MESVTNVRRMFRSDTCLAAWASANFSCHDPSMTLVTRVSPLPKNILSSLRHGEITVMTGVFLKKKNTYILLYGTVSDTPQFQSGFSCLSLFAGYIYSILPTVWGHPTVCRMQLLLPSVHDLQVRNLKKKQWLWTNRL